MLGRELSNLQEKKAGTYRIFFVMTLEAGKMRESDLLIGSVMDAVQSNGRDFNIIFNKLSPKEKSQLADMSAIRAQINQKRHKTDSIHMIEIDPRYWHDEGTQFITIDYSFLGNFFSTKANLSASPTKLLKRLLFPEARATGRRLIVAEAIEKRLEGFSDTEVERSLCEGP